MKHQLTKKIFSIISIALLFLAQFQFALLLMQPQIAQAYEIPTPAGGGAAAINSAAGLLAPLSGLIKTDQIVGSTTSVHTSIQANPIDGLQKALENLARGIASTVVDRLSTEFIQQLVNKYQIRNFLYYDQALINYYLDRYIQDKISDPDLRKIFNLLEAGYVTGAPTGTTGGPDPRSALIPQLVKATSNYHIQTGGITVDQIANSAPGTYKTPQEFWNSAHAMFGNTEGMTGGNLVGQFADIQASSSTATQLEIVVGNGLKAGRIIGGTCTGLPPSLPSGAQPDTSQAACQAAGGKWNPSALDQARSFINNPTVKIDHWLQSGLNKLFDTKYDPSNYWYVIGAATGSFLFTELKLNQKGNDLISDGGDPYAATDGPDASSVINASTGVDLDGDGLFDGYDINADGKIDICVYGGTAPDNCASSKEVLAGTGGAPDFISLARQAHPEQFQVIIAVKQELISEGTDLSGPCGEFKIVEQVAWQLKDFGAGLLKSTADPSCPVSQGQFAADEIMFSDGYVFRIINNSDSTKPNQPDWTPIPPKLTDMSVYVKAFNPEPVCANSGLAFTVFNYLESTKDQVKAWNTSSGTTDLGSTGITTDQIDTIRDGLNTMKSDQVVKNNTSTPSYKDQIDAIRDNLNTLKFYINFNIGNDPGNALKSQYKTALNAFRTAILKGLNDLIAQLSASPQCQ